jgi:hypothetical protein
MAGFWQDRDRRRRIGTAIGIYVATTIVYFAFAARETLVTHTSFNHYALLAESWLEGRLDLGGPPPAHTGNNDFSRFEGQWYVTFPPFPALLLLPLVAIGGSAARVQDGQLFLWLSGIGPAISFLAFEKLGRMGLSHCGTRWHIVLSLLFAFGTVYFFSAEQGTVWYAAHVIGVALAAAYLLFALDASHPILAGTMLALAFLTRPPLLFAAPLFLAEALRVTLRSRSEAKRRDPEQLELELSLRSEQLELPLVANEPKPLHARRVGDLAELWQRLDKRRLFVLCAAFAVPIGVGLALSMWHNAARFGDPFDSGYRHLVIAWRGRIERWGLFDYHYLARNLGVVLTSLPWRPEPGSDLPFRINLHGLALWVTTPMYLWLLWPRRVTALHIALWITVAAVAVPTLFYQNSGWVQFGYRFSNDYAIFLFALLAIGGYRFGSLFRACAIWAVVVNAFGAWTFGRPEYARYYHQDNTQRTLYQPD